MNKIRYGTYTYYKNQEMPMIELYGHGISDPDIENKRIISYPEEKGPIDDFKLDSINHRYFKYINLPELENAYIIVTKAIYKGEELIVWSFNPENKNITIFTTDPILGEKLNLIKLSDRYIQEVGMDEIQKVWEEVSKSPFNLPIPKEIKTYKEINLNDLL